MRLASKEYIIETVYSTNVLPVTSECNTSCIFCSHKQNPPGVEVYRMPKLDLHDFKEIIDFLSPERKIIIGESATRIIEGEPLTRKDIIDIIMLIRKKYKHTPIQLTTNGILLDANIIERLAQMEPVELNISVNCIDPKKRMIIFGRRAKDDIIQKLGMLRGKIRYSGSLVIVPNILDYRDVEDVIAQLSENEADIARIYLPGYTRRCEFAVDLLEMYEEVKSFIKPLKKKYSIPVIVEPSFVTDLVCRVEGVINNTPAKKAGIREGDIILSINGEDVHTRVEAFNKIYTMENPTLTVKRGSKQKEIILFKRRNSSPGFVLLYDIDYDVIDKVNKAISFYGANKALLITSELAFNTVSEVFKKGRLLCDCNIISAKNNFFGGTIKCAGLLTVQDILTAASEHLKNNEKPDLLLLPPIMFDHRGRDLVGTNIKDIERRLGVKADTI